jgi:hypothetical protein
MNLLSDGCLEKKQVLILNNNVVILALDQINVNTGLMAENGHNGEFYIDKLKLRCYYRL